MVTAYYSYDDPLLTSSPDLWWADLLPLDSDRQEVRHYQDVGDRQQLTQLMIEGREGKVQRIVVNHWGDLGDGVLEVGDRLAELTALGIVVEQHEGRERSPWENSVLQWQQLHEYYQRRTIQRGHAQNRIHTLPPPGKAPYGYRRGKDRYIIDRSTSPVIREFVEHFLLYGTLRGSVRFINQKYGKAFSVSTGRRWLTSPIYRGDLIYGTGDVIPDTHAAIVTRDEAAQVDRLLRRNRRLPPKTASAPRSLAGLVRCGRCQTGLTVGRVSQRGDRPDYLYLRPQHCPLSAPQRPCAAFPYQAVLDRTIETICATLPDAIAGLATPSPDVQQEMARQEEILQELPRLVASGILDQPSADLRAYRVRATLATLRDRQAQRPPSNLGAIAQALSIPQFWQDLSEAERRVYFREFIDQITLTRSGGDRTDWSLTLGFVFNRPRP